MLMEDEVTAVAKGVVIEEIADMLEEASPATVVAVYGFLYPNKEITAEENGGVFLVKEK